MAKTRAQRQVYADLLNRYGRSVADAFLEAIDKIKSAASIQRLTAAIEARDIEGALDILDIDPADFNDVLDRIRDANQEGGKTTADQMPKRKPDGTALNIRFDGRNPEAERGVRERALKLVGGLTADARRAGTNRIADGLARGDGPKKIALDLVGRMNRVTQKREGGVVGLSVPQEEAARRARDELASDDAAGLRNYLTRKRRDRRFDRSVTKAIREGAKVDPAIAAKANTAYERRLLQTRGETIGRVETMTAIQAAKREAFRQAAAEGKVDESSIRKAWRSAGDLRVRHTHVMLNGESAAFNEPFVSTSGALMQHPMDTSLGAGVAEIANCRCDCEYRIDFLANLR